MYDIAIVGGGASGMAAALQARRTAPHLAVSVIERQPRVGKKLMATGNGRCNLTNRRADITNYHGGTSIMREAMRRYPPEAVIDFFRELGVEPLYEGDKVYPLSEQASSVLDVLRFALDEAGVMLITGSGVAQIEPLRPGFRLTTQDGQRISASKLIMAAGSPSAPSLGGTDVGLRLMESLGHRLTLLLPALVQLKTPTEPIRALTGIKFEGSISILVDGEHVRTECGEVLFTEYGLSGPPVLQLSRVASEALAKRKRPFVSLHILPQPPFRLLRERRALLAARPLEHFLTGMLNKRLGQTLLKLAGCQPLSRPSGSLSEFEIDTLARLMHDWPLPVTGTQGFASAQVMAGGVRTGEFDPQTLQSRIVPGLYAAGELLDVDGDCGGFNLQWAWASGLLAGQSAALALMEER